MPLAATSSLPLVSVIVPTHNYGHYISQTLESIRKQTYHNWECIIIDDGSTDDTRSVVAQYAKKDKRIKYIYQRNQRQAVAKNTGITNSIGKYLQFLDADDLIEAKKLERQVKYLEEHLEVDIIYGGVRYFSTENMDDRRYSMLEENKPWMPEISGKGKTLLLALAQSNIMAINSSLLRRSVIDSVGNFDEILPPLEDWDFWIRCAAQGKHFQYEDIEDSLALVRSHPLSSSKDSRVMLMRSLLVRKKIEAMTTDPDILKLNRSQLAEEEAALGIQEVIHRRSSKAIYYLSKSCFRDGKILPRMKWLAFAFISPFITREKILEMATSPLTQPFLGALRKSKKHLLRNTN